MKKKLKETELHILDKCEIHDIKTSDKLSIYVLSCVRYMVNQNSDSLELEFDKFKVTLSLDYRK